MANRYCPKCGYEIERDDRFCLRCGADVPRLEEPDHSRISSHDEDDPNEGSANQQGGDDSRSDPDTGETGIRVRETATHPDGGTQEGGTAQEAPAIGAGASRNPEETQEPGQQVTHASTDAPERPTTPAGPRTDEHDWPGKLWVGLNWFSFWGTLLGLVAVGIITLGERGGSDLSVATGAVISVMMILLFVFYYWLIRAVRDFKKKGWYVLMVLLPFGLLGQLTTVFTTEEPGQLFASFVGLSLSGLWIWYFWAKRRMYGIK